MLSTAKRSIPRFHDGGDQFVTKTINERNRNSPCQLHYCKDVLLAMNTKQSTQAKITGTLLNNQLVRKQSRDKIWLPWWRRRLQTKALWLSRSHSSNILMSSIFCAWPAAIDALSEDAITKGTCTWAGLQNISRDISMTYAQPRSTRRLLLQGASKLDCTPSLDQYFPPFVSVNHCYEAVLRCPSKPIFGEVDYVYLLSDGSSPLPWASIKVSQSVNNSKSCHV